MSLTSPIRPALRQLRPRILSVQYRQRATFSFTRAFTQSTATMAPKQEWLITIPDHPNCLEKRMSVRPAHLEALKPLISSGTLVLGGALLEEPAKEGQTPKSNGSALIILAETQEEAEKIVKNDVYAKEGVWDIGGMTVRAFKSAVRQGL